MYYVPSVILETRKSRKLDRRAKKISRNPGKLGGILEAKGQEGHIGLAKTRAAGFRLTFTSSLDKICASAPLMLQLIALRKVPREDSRLSRGLA